MARRGSSIAVLVLITCCVVLSKATTVRHLRLESNERDLPTRVPLGHLESYPLPVIFFHGLGGTAASGAIIGANLTAEGRHFEAINVCEAECTGGPLDLQVQLSLAKVKQLVASTPNVYERGYIFIGHSLGALIARAIIEEWDDHKVYMLVSLAGTQNGVFYGPQADDAVPAYVFTYKFGPLFLPVLDYSKYKASAAMRRGPLQRDVHTAVEANPALQNKLVLATLARSPVRSSWLHVNKFFAKLNNVIVCEAGEAGRQCCADKERRRRNFERLQVLHLFISPQDEAVAPWQSAIMGQYSEVSSAQEIETKFEAFRVLSMQETEEYKHNTYGLKSHDLRGTLHMHVVDRVSHSCWLRDIDESPVVPGGCKFQPVWEEHIYPVLQTPGCFGLRLADALWAQRS